MAIISNIIIIFLALVIMGTSGYSFWTAGKISDPIEKRDQRIVSGSSVAFAVLIIIIVGIILYRGKKAA